MRNWNSMSKTHEIQSKIMKEINSFSFPEHGRFSSDSQRKATRQLESVIQAWHTCFSDYISAQKAYVKSLQGWLSKFIDAEEQYIYTSNFSLPLARSNAPALLVTCQRWSMYLDKLPDMSVKYAMKSLGKDIKALWIQQGVEQQQKRKVDGLHKDFERKMLMFGKADEKVHVSEHEALSCVNEQGDFLDEKRKQLEIMSRKVEMERERHRSSVEETELVAMKRLQMGLSSAFESLAEFSKALTKVYGDLVAFSQSSKD